MRGRTGVAFDGGDDVVEAVEADVFVGRVQRWLAAVHRCHLNDTIIIACVRACVRERECACERDGEGTSCALRGRREALVRTLVAPPRAAFNEKPPE